MEERRRWTLASVGTWWSRWRRWAAQHFGWWTEVAGVIAYGRKTYKKTQRK